MMGKKLSSLVALIFSSICSIAQADSFYTGTVTTADHGLILSAEGGYGWLLGTPNKTMNGHSGSAQVGALNWGANIGYAWALDAISAISLEVGYADNGQNKYSGPGTPGDSGQLKITSIDYQFLGGFNTIWENGINFFVKLGGAVINQKANLSNTAIINGTSVSAFNNSKYYVEPMAVIGLGYKITPNVNIYVEGSGIYGNYNTSWGNVGTTPSDINKVSAVVAVKGGLSFAFAE